MGLEGASGSTAAFFLGRALGSAARFLFLPLVSAMVLCVGVAAGFGIGVATCCLASRYFELAAGQIIFLKLPYRRAADWLIRLKSGAQGRQGHKVGATPDMQLR